jgi:hypothetical protein
MTKPANLKESQFLRFCPFRHVFTGDCARVRREIDNPANDFRARTVAGKVRRRNNLGVLRRV